MQQAANDDQAYTADDAFAWCECGSGTYWLWLEPETGWYRVVCSQCDYDHSHVVCGG